jgi:DNA-binding NarL/FixJ family response regulator
MKQTRLLVVDDHAVVRKGIQMMVSTEPGIEIVAEAGNGQEAVHQACLLQPDVVLMDLVMSQGNGLEAIAAIKRCSPQIKIIVLTTFEDQTRVTEAIEAGADGYLLKDADGDALLRAIQETQQGGMPLHPRVARHLIKGKLKYPETDSIASLTEREKDVLRLMVKGLSNKGVAQSLHLSEGTVKIHVSNILSKLEVTSRTEAAMIAVQRGLITLEEDETLK